MIPILDLRGLDISKVQSMKYMFYCCRASKIDLSSFKLFDVNDTQDMFKSCYSEVIASDPEILEYLKR